MCVCVFGNGIEEILGLDVWEEEEEGGPGGQGRDPWFGIGDWEAGVKYLGIIYFSNYTYLLPYLVG